MALRKQCQNLQLWAWENPRKRTLCSPAGKEQLDGAFPKSIENKGVSVGKHALAAGKIVPDWVIYTPMLSGSTEKEHSSLTLVTVEVKPHLETASVRHGYPSPSPMKYLFYSPFL